MKGFVEGPAIKTKCWQAFFAKWLGEEVKLTSSEHVVYGYLWRGKLYVCRVEELTPEGDA